MMSGLSVTAEPSKAARKPGQYGGEDDWASQQDQGKGGRLWSPSPHQRGG